MRKLLQKIGHILILFFSLTALAACGLNLAGQIGNPPSPTLSPTSTPPQRFVISPTLTHSNLDKLTSYRANLVIDFEGVYQGQPTNGHLENLIEVRRQPAQQHYYLNLEGALPTTGLEAGIAQFFQIGQTIYLKKAAGQSWSQFRQDNASLDSFDLPEPARLIIVPSAVSTPPQRETLNGLRAQGYRFNETDLLDQTNYVFEKADGNLWIAAPGDYLLQYVISATLRVVRPDPKAYLFDTGSIRLSYVLTDIDADFTVKPPANIAVGNDEALDALPRLPDAETITVLPTLLEYTSAISPISAALFYRQVLSSANWMETDAQIFNEKAQLVFSQADQHLKITIAPASYHDKIKISLNLE